MGDRINVKVVFRKEGTRKRPQSIYLYNQWIGEMMPEVVRQALARKQRWDQPSYLCRIIFSEMIRRGRHDGQVSGEEFQLQYLGEETGHGISPYETAAGDRPTITVDTSKQTVEVNKRTFSFAAYIKMTAEEVTSVHLND